MSNLIKQKEIEIIDILKIYFKRIDGYDNYFVSNFGNVINSKTNKMLKPRNDIQGYNVINLYQNGKYKTFKVHRLVGIAFLENPDNKPMIVHIDDNKSNNDVKNLRWVTRKEIHKEFYYKNK